MISSSVTCHSPLMHRHLNVSNSLNKSKSNLKSKSINEMADLDPEIYDEIVKYYKQRNAYFPL